MKKLIALALVLLSKGNFALTCPSVEVVNQALNKSGAYPGQTLSIPHKDFNFPWVYVDNAPHKKILIEAIQLVGTKIEGTIGLGCIYKVNARWVEQPEKWQKNTFIGLLNTDQSQFIGTIGNWHVGYKGTFSICYNEFGNCVFERI